MALIEALVGEFSNPGDEVAFHNPTREQPPLDLGLGSAMGAVTRLGRRPTLAGAGVGCAALVLAQVAAGSGDGVAHHGLVMPRPGGVLAVLTGTTNRGGRLIDPTWAIVCAARAGGARYVGHIIAAHTDTWTDTATETRTATETARPHRANQTGEAPAPAGIHPRTHHDVLVFHRTPTPAPAAIPATRSDPPAPPGPPLPPLPARPGGIAPVVSPRARVLAGGAR